MREQLLAVAFILLPVFVAVEVLTRAHHRARHREAMKRRYGATPWHQRDWRDR